MDGTGVEAIAALAVAAAKERSPDIVDVDGEKFSTAKLTALPHPREHQRATPLELHTLSGLAEYLNENRDGLEQTEALVHVRGPRWVQVISPLGGHDYDRHVYATAVATDAVDGSHLFELNEYMPTEDFIIGLQALFADEGGRSDVLRLVGNLEDEVVQTEVDDGTTQRVVAKSSTAGVDNFQVPNPVQLAPYQTFPELDPTARSFVLRVSKGSRGMVAGLWEVSDVSWTTDVISKIIELLKGQITGGFEVIG